MSYQQNSSRLRRLPDFFGITDSSGLMPLSQIRDNGIINNGERSKDKEPGMDKPSVLGQLSQAKKECAERKPPELGKPGKDEPEL